MNFVSSSRLRNPDGCIPGATASFALEGSRWDRRAFLSAGAAALMYSAFPMVAAHASEIAYKFDKVQPRNALAPSPSGGAPQGGGMTGDASPASIQAALNMSEFWSTFARTGHPSAKERPVWPPYKLASRPTMLIDAQCRVVNDPTKIEREMWQRVDPA